MARKHMKQVAALPWRMQDDGLQVLLVTSRETKRWVIPKGWPMRGLSDSQAAAQEALEEAGIKGEIARRKLGSYRYEKRKEQARNTVIDVDVYPMQVEKEMRSWREMSERERQWFDPETARNLVEEPALKSLIGALALGAGTGEPVRSETGQSDSLWTRFLRLLGAKG